MPTEQATAELADETSFASPIAPEETGEFSERLIIVWGRCWGEQSHIRASFFARYNVTNSEFDHLTVRIHDSVGELAPYDPDQSCAEFLHTILENRNESNGDTSKKKKVRQGIEQSFHQAEAFETIVDALETTDRDRFKEWGRELSRRIIPTGETTFQLKGRIMPSERFAELTSDEDTTNQTDEHEPSDTGEQDTDGAGDQHPTVDMNFLTSPVNGRPPGELSEGDVVMGRITGKVVQQLPDSMIDEEWDQSTVPLPCRFEEMSLEENQARLKVVVDDGIKGVGFVSPETRVKTSGEEESDSESSNPFAEIVLLLMLLVSILLLLTQL